MAEIAQVGLHFVFSSGYHRPSNYHNSTCIEQEYWRFEWSHWCELKMDTGKDSSHWDKDNQIDPIGYGNLGHRFRIKQDKGHVLEMG